MVMAEKIIIFCFLSQGVCCRNSSISFPVKIEALSGSCVIINCTFEIEEKYDNDLTERATGVWLKYGTDLNKNVVFNSSTLSQKSHIKGNITGKLKDKNCTTVFYDLKSNDRGQYYFRVESIYKLKHIFKQASVLIDVIESPHKPTVQLYTGQKVVQDQEEVLEESSVSLRCSAETLCSASPPTLTWSSSPTIPLSESSRLQELILISDLNFTATQHHHGVTFTCTITYQLQDKNKTAQNNITLHVQYSPKNTSVSASPSSSVLEGSSVTLTCSSDANPAGVNYTWTRESEGQMKQLQTGDTLTFNRTDPTHWGWHHCTAQNQHGSHNSSVMLDIQYAPRISLSSCRSGDVTVCFCVVDGNPSPELEWHLSGRPVTNSSNTFISEERLSSISLRSSITLQQSLTNTSTLQCVSKNTHGTARQLFQLLPSTTCLSNSSVLIEVAVGALVVLMMCAITYTYVRKENMKLLQARGEGATRSILTNEAAPQENQGDLVSLRMSSAEATTANQDTIIYSSIDFTNSKPREVVSVSSLHAVHSRDQDCSGGLAKTRSSVEKFSRAREAQVIVSADVITKQTEEELLVDSSQLYTKVQRRNP